MSPRVTVETLAALVEQGFENQEKQHDRMDKRLDRFEEQVLNALEQRPTRGEVHVLVKAATKHGNGNGNGKTHWWDAWGRIAAILLALAGALGAGIAAAMQSGG